VDPTSVGRHSAGLRAALAGNLAGTPTDKAVFGPEIIPRSLTVRIRISLKPKRMHERLAPPRERSCGPIKYGCEEMTPSERPNSK
jgi:hypothetical protein